MSAIRKTGERRFGRQQRKSLKKVNIWHRWAGGGGEFCNWSLVVYYVCIFFFHIFPPVTWSFHSTTTNLKKCIQMSVEELKEQQFSSDQRWTGSFNMQRKLEKMSPLFLLFSFSSAPAPKRTFGSSKVTAAAGTHRNPGLGRRQISVRITWSQEGRGETILRFSFSDKCLPRPSTLPQGKGIDMDKFWVSQTQQPYKWSSKDSPQRSVANSLGSGFGISWVEFCPPALLPGC